MYPTLEVARDKYDIKESYERSQEKLSEQFYSQMYQKEITINMLLY